MVAALRRIKVAEFSAGNGDGGGRRGRAGEEDEQESGVQSSVGKEVRGRSTSHRLSELDSEYKIFSSGGGAGLVCWACGLSRLGYIHIHFFLPGTFFLF